MIDIRLIREKPDFVRERLATRGGGDEEKIDEVLRVDAERRKTETELQRSQSERNRLSKEIGAKRSRDEPSEELEAQVRKIGEQIGDLTQRASSFDEAQRDLLLETPNVPHESVPIGKDPSANRVVRSWGEKPRLTKPADHVALGTRLNLFDLDRAAKLSGSGFICFTGAGARLERSLINFMIDLHTREHGLSFAELPKKFVAYTPCFRREAGAAGRETQGIIRVHQFDKVELVKITRPEKSYEEFESLAADAERVLQLLGLHYRVVELCTGDLGFASAKTYDIEVWSPGRDAFLEVSSCSNVEDFQARRMRLRFKDRDGKNRFCHTLNASGLALPRLFAALIENYQQPDGSVNIPEKLQPYFGAEKINHE